MSTELATTPDPFAVLGLAPAFDLDVGALEARFRERSREVHPDWFATASAAERAQALIRTRVLNDAYQLLKRPQSRAEYLLSRAGLAIGDRERLDPTFLAEILELREELAEARHTGRLDDVARHEAAMKDRRRAILELLPPLFAVGDPESLADAKRHLITLRYVARYLEECDVALEAAG